MNTVRKGLREGEIKKDTFERLLCSACDMKLQTENDPEEIGSVRSCPECGKRWRRLR